MSASTEPPIPAEGSPRHAGVHRHQASLEDTLAFVNTLEFSSQGSREDLATPADVLGWLRSKGLLHGDGPGGGSPADEAAASRLLDEARTLRSAFREVIEAVAERRAAPGHAVDRVNGALGKAYAYELEPAPDGIALGHRHEGDDAQAALAALAAALVDGVTEGSPERVKVCANDRCRWVFRDTSPAGRRRWCDMTSCGNQAKARRHRERVRAGARGGHRRDGAASTDS